MVVVVVGEEVEKLKDVGEDNMPFCFGSCNSAADCEPGCACTPSGWMGTGTCSGGGGIYDPKKKNRRRRHRGRQMGGSRGHWRQGGSVTRKPNSNNSNCPKGYSMSAQGVCTQSLGSDSTFGHWASGCNDCHQQCYSSMSHCGGYSSSPQGPPCSCTSMCAPGGNVTITYECQMGGGVPDGTPIGGGMCQYEGCNDWTYYCYTDPMHCVNQCSGFCGAGAGYSGEHSGAGEHGGGRGWSDINLKENIELVGKSKSGINIYEFDYKDKKYGEGRYRGVMAQEVPEASYEKEGHLWVDYSKLDVEFRRI